MSTPKRGEESDVETLDLSNARVGEPLRLPAGTVVRSMNPKHAANRTLRRAQTVYPYFVNRYGDIIEVMWAGSGGYWQRVRAEA
jgi:hypothetical protein